jgi:phenylacetate-CoA ligase
MHDLTPDPSTLDPIELAPREELAALQLDRMRWSLQHAYDNVAHYRRAFDAAVWRRRTCARSRTSALPADQQGRPAGQLPLRHARRAARAGPAGAREQRHDGQPTVVGYTDRDLSTWADVMARSIRAAGGRPGQMVHNAYGYGLFTGGLGAHAGAERLGCTVVPVSGGQTERQVG